MVPPLVVDLDGTLIHADMLHESALRLLRDSPLGTLRIPFWLVKGKAPLKRQLAARSTLDASSLPYNLELLSWLRAQKESGRQLVLCTASDRRVADRVAEHLQIFDDVIASDGVVNLGGQRKADVLEARFGRAGFDYAGNAKSDVNVWARARRAIVVNASGRTERRAGEVCEIECVMRRPTRGLATWWSVLRVHQWLKNLLLFVPTFAAHRIDEPNAWTALLVSFASFSACASSVYVANDLLDLESDRLHPRKRHRPFASGKLPAWAGVLLAPILLFASLTLAFLVGERFTAWLLVYFALTCAYSWGLKRLVLVDCLVLAMLYTVRIVAGAAAVEQNLSFWLLAFSVFLFLSLAFVKRYAELQVQQGAGKDGLHGRGYRTQDIPLIHVMGISAGYAAVLVLALYLNSVAVVESYRAPEIVWGTVPVMLFWISWMWMQAHRGEMHDDPLEFAVKNRTSWLAGLTFALVIVVGARGLPW